MTVGLQLQDGINTIDLNDGNYVSIIELDIGGGDISAETVSGSMRLYIEGTRSQIQGELLYIQKILQEAVDYSGRGAGGALYSSLDKPVYILYRSDGSDTYHRSEIVKASYYIEPSSIEALNCETGEIVYVIDFERYNWWEGAEVQLQLSTAKETATTNAVSVFNPYSTDDNSTVCNYVNIADTQVTGDLPSACRIEMINTFDSVAETTFLMNLAHVWIGHSFTNATTLRTILPVAAPTTYETINVPTATETNLADWELEDALIDAAAGRFFKFMPAFKTALLGQQNIRYRVKFQISGSTFWQTSYARLDSSYATGIRDMFTFAVPPTLAGMDDLEGYHLVLSAYHELGTTQAISIDYAQLLPADGFRYLYSMGTAQNERIVLDGFNRVEYQDNGSGLLKVPYIRASGSQIMLQPGRTQRLYFMQHTNYADAHYTSESMTVKVYTRPRRLTI